MTQDLHVPPSSCVLGRTDLECRVSPCPSVSLNVELNWGRLSSSPGAPGSRILTPPPSRLGPTPVVPSKSPLPQTPSPSPSHRRPFTTSVPLGLHVSSSLVSVPSSLPDPTVSHPDTHVSGPSLSSHSFPVSPSRTLDGCPTQDPGLQSPASTGLHGNPSGGTQDSSTYTSPSLSSVPDQSPNTPSVSVRTPTDLVQSPTL